MKKPGDGWTKIDWHICPFCGKKGYYWALAIKKGWRCKYCKEYGKRPEYYLN